VAQGAALTRALLSAAWWSCTHRWWSS
jgi:hypothetical protein